MEIEEFRQCVEDAAALLRDVNRVMPGISIVEFLQLADNALDKKNSQALKLLRNCLQPQAVMRINEAV